MADKVIKSVNCGLGITLDIYPNHEWEYTFMAAGSPPKIAEEVQQAVSTNPMFAYQAATAVVNRYLAAAGLPTVNEPLVK